MKRIDFRLLPTSPALSRNHNTYLHHIKLPSPHRRLFTAPTHPLHPLLNPTTRLLSPTPPPSSTTDTPNIWRTPSNASAYWDLYLSTRPPYSHHFFSQIYSYHACHTSSFLTALDIGTGCGQAIPKLLERFPHVIASDNNAEHIAEARRRLQQQQDGRQIDFLVSKGEDLTSPSSPSSPPLLSPNSIDLITAAECMPLLDTTTAITTFGTLLRPGGTLAMWFYGRPRFTEPSFVITCQPLFDQILDRTFRMAVSGGGWEHQQAWKRALQGMRSWLDDIALPAHQWHDVRRTKWNTHAELPFFGDAALDFEAPEMVCRVGPGEMVREVRDEGFWEMRWDGHGVRRFVEASFPGLKERQDGDGRLQDLLGELEGEMGGVGEVRRFTWPAVLVLAARV